MDSRDHDEIMENAEGDRLSNLPDDLIHKILSSISIKHVVQTSVLSSRWRYIWTSTPYLNFSTKDFRRLPRFSKFVTRLLSGRNNQSQVISVNLTFRGKVSHEFVQRILDYALSHNVQQLNITCLLGHVYYLVEFPPSLSSSHSIKHLTLTGNIHIEKYPVMTTPIWTLPNLTTLSLTFFDDKCAGLLSNCANLRNLVLKNCTNSFSISHPGLSSLTFENGSKRVNVVTPQLKNLTIKQWRGIHVVSAPNLSFLRYTDHYFSCKVNDGGTLHLPTDLPHLEKVDICIDALRNDKAYTRKIVRVLQQLHCVKFLTLNLEFVKCFSSSVKLISRQASPFVNLKSLKIYPVNVSPVEQTQEEATMPMEVKNYLLGGSPGAIFTMVSHEEIRVMKSVTSAQNLMRELQDKLKENIDTQSSHIEQDKNQMALVRMVSEDTRSNISMLRRIITLLAKVPISHPDKCKLQARVFGLLVEMNTNIRHVLNLVEMRCDKNPLDPNRLHDKYFQVLNWPSGEVLKDMLLLTG